MPKHTLSRRLQDQIGKLSLACIYAVEQAVKQYAVIHRRLLIVRSVGKHLLPQLPAKQPTRPAVHTAVFKIRAANIKRVCVLQQMVAKQMIFQLALQQPQLRIERIPALRCRFHRKTTEELNPIDGAQRNRIRVEPHAVCRHVGDETVNPARTLRSRHSRLAKPIHIILVVCPQHPVRSVVPPAELILNVEKRKSPAVVALPLRSRLRNHRLDLHRRACQCLEPGFMHPPQHLKKHLHRSQINNRAQHQPYVHYRLISPAQVFPGTDCPHESSACSFP